MKRIKERVILICGFRLAIIVFLNIFSYSVLNASEIQSPDSLKEKSDISLYGFYQQGWVLPTNAFISGSNVLQKPVSSYSAGSIQISVQTKGDNLWEQLYNFPRYGFGFYKPQFSDAPYLGNPVSVYGSMSFALKRWGSLVFNLDVGFGLTFNWRSYMEDKYNLALGASESIIFNPAISLEKRMRNGLIINAGAGFTHFSNGSLKVPNLGINIFSPRIGLGYNFTGSEQKFKYQVVPDCQKQSEYLVSLFVGWRNQLYYGSDVDSVTMRKGVYYSIYGLSFAYNMQVSHKSKFGAGVMVDYLGYANFSITAEDGKLIANPASFRNGLELSIYPSYELIMNRMSLLLQPGFYIYRAKYPERTPFNYQRVGLKYYITDDVSMSLNMRAHYWSIADFIEWTIGYRIR